MKKKLLLSLFALLTVLFFACSGDDGDDNPTDGQGSNELTSTYKIKNITANSFIMENTYYECYEESFKNNGELEIEREEDKIDYSIENDSLTLYGDEGYFFKPMHFNGTSTSLIGTWTREANLCKIDEEQEIYCGNDFFSKVAFTNTTLTITYDMCWTKNYFDREKGTYEKDGGVTLKIIDCNTSEASYRNHKATTTFAINTKVSPIIQVAYNQTTCSKNFRKDITVSERQTACKEAYNRAKDEDGDYKDMWLYYEESIGINFRETVECLRDTGMPEELGGEIVEQLRILSIL